MNALSPSVFDEKPWMALPDAALEPTRQVPTMLRPAERRLYLWLAESWADGAGEIVDLGCFAGGSTALLAEGMRRSGRGGRRVHGFDAFRISEPLKRKYLYKAGVPPFEGDDMLAVSRALLAPWDDLVRLHPGRIEQQGWDGAPIEILTLDASKSVTTMDAMAEIFFPHLIPGRSVIVQQDFLHWKQPWVAVQMERMAAWFQPLALAPSDSVAFLCTAPVDDAALAAGRCRGLGDQDYQSALKALRRRMRGLGVGKGLKLVQEAVTLNPGKRGAAGFTVRPGARSR